MVVGLSDWLGPTRVEPSLFIKGCFRVDCFSLKILIIVEYNAVVSRRHSKCGNMFVVALDCTGNVLAKIVGGGRVKAEETDAAIGEYIEPTSLLCTNTATNYKKYALLKNLKHETVNLNQNQRVKKAILHIQHVNNFHRRLKG
ncbi:hypothetical protein FJQ64_03710 [Lysinibacillus sp. BW-2-10]|nr:hypothetical protein FJQ64_03710 [Lysinibacillus sp. BW-2-10]